MIWISSKARVALAALVAFLSVVSSANAVESGDAIEIAINETQRIPIRQLQRMLAVNPSIASARVLNETSIAVEGVAVGETSLHVWDANGFRTFRITVVWKKRAQQNSGQDIRRRGRLDYKFQKASGYASLLTEKSGLKRSQEAMTHSLNVVRSLGDGQLTTSANYVDMETRGQTGETGLERANARWTNKEWTVAGGDIETSFVSDLSMGFSEFQGASVSRRQGPLEAKIVSGGTNQPFWRPERTGMLEKPSAQFGGFRLSGRGSDQFSSQLTFLSRFGRPDGAAEPALSPQKTFGAGAQFTTGALVNEVDLASSEKMSRDKAYRVSTSFRSPLFSARVGLRDVAPDYQTVYGGALLQGQKGGDALLEVGSLKTVRVETRFDHYLDRHSSTEAPDDADVVSRHAAVSRSVDALRLKLSVDGDARRMDYYTSKTRRSRAEAEYALSPEFKLGTAVSNLRLYGSQVADQVSGEVSVGLGGAEGFQAIVGGGAAKLQRAGEEARTNALYRVLVAYRRPHALGGLKLAWRMGMNNLQLDTNEKIRELFSAAEVERNITGAFSTFLSFGAQHSYATGFLPARNSAHIEMGGRFSTPLRAPMEEVRGYAFFDMNGDGIRQKDEKAMADVRILVDGEKKCRADHEGRFRVMVRIDDEMAEVRVDSHDIPAGMVPTTPHPWSIDRNWSSSSQVVFGFGPKRRLSGRVFFDRNGNGRFDADEKPLKDAAIWLNGLEPTRTDGEGRYVLNNMPVGPSRITITGTSLPANFYISANARLEVNMADGDDKEINFPIQPLRGVSGRVCLDRNGNGTCEDNEAGYPDTVVKANGRSVFSNAKGEYFLKQLPGGDVNVTALRPGGDVVKTVSLPTDEPANLTLDFAMPK